MFPSSSTHTTLAGRPRQHRSYRTRERMTTYALIFYTGFVPNLDIRYFRCSCYHVLALIRLCGNGLSSAKIATRRGQRVSIM
jgi:hypothetical protein